jgi:hypothetical protein
MTLLDKAKLITLPAVVTLANNRKSILVQQKQLLYNMSWMSNLLVMQRNPFVEEAY